MTSFKEISKWFCNFVNESNKWTNYRIIFQTWCHISILFTSKSKTPSMRVGFLIEVQSNGRQSPIFFFKLCGELRICGFTENKVKGKVDSTIKVHLSSFDHSPDHSHFSKLGCGNKDHTNLP